MAPANQLSVMAPLLVGVAIIFLTVIVYMLILLMVVRIVRRGLMHGRVRFWGDLTLVMSATLLGLAGHFIEVALWALSFVLCGEFSNFSAALYYSGNTYTTLGDSTTVLSARWRMLGPIEAANGMLMFGVSTAIIFAVILRLIEAKFGLQRDPPPAIARIGEALSTYHSFEEIECAFQYPAIPLAFLYGESSGVRVELSVDRDGERGAHA